MTDAGEIFLTRVDANGETVRLRLVDYGGVGRVGLLLHGLAGAAHEWRDTAAWLSKTHRWRESWPLPFADRSSARISFGGKSDAARVWSEMLEETADGCRPTFNCDDIIASVRDGENVRDYADDWRRIACPTLIMAGESGWIGHEVAQMIALNRRAKADVVPRAGHDVHLETPDLWRSSVQKFLGEECAR